MYYGQMRMGLVRARKKTGFQGKRVAVGSEPFFRTDRGFPDAPEPGPTGPGSGGRAQLGRATG
ncbi:MAG: hypothetical protein Kow0092_07720 [Deferrisomatales bacterium]